MAAKIPIHESSGNVFEDLGLPNSQELLVKSGLVQRLGQVIESRGLSQREIADTLGVDQPKISKLLRGQFNGFSTDRLLRFLRLLDQDIEIVLRNKPAKADRNGRVSVRSA